MHARHFTSWFSSRLARQMDRFGCPLDWTLRKGEQVRGRAPHKLRNLSLRRLAWRRPTWEPPGKGLRPPSWPAKPADASLRLHEEGLHYHTKAGRARFDPVEELGEAVDLVVVTAMGKLQQFAAEVIKPGRSPRQMHLTAFDAGGLGMHACGRRCVV